MDEFCSFFLSGVCLPHTQTHRAFSFTFTFRESSSFAGDSITEVENTKNWTKNPPLSLEFHYQATRRLSCRYLVFAVLSLARSLTLWYGFCCNTTIIIIYLFISIIYFLSVVSRSVSFLLCVCVPWSVYLSASLVFMFMFVLLMLSSFCVFTRFECAWTNTQTHTCTYGCTSFVSLRIKWARFYRNFNSTQNTLETRIKWTNCEHQLQYTRIQYVAHAICCRLMLFALILIRSLFFSRWNEKNSNFIASKFRLQWYIEKESKEWVKKIHWWMMMIYWKWRRQQQQQQHQ